jgi:hypothetical protein
MRFSKWIEMLEEDVIQGEYGYEPGEFTVYPDLWRPSFKEGLTPSQAFAKALEAFGDQRAEDDRRKTESWERIQEEDRIARGRAAHPHS